MNIFLSNLWQLQSLFEHKLQMTTAISCEWVVNINQAIMIWSTNFQTCFVLLLGIELLRSAS